MVKTLHWGLVGAGRISHDFAICLRTLKQAGHEIIAVADKVPGKAAEFSKLHGIPTAYESFTEIAKNPNIDVAYIATLNPDHYHSTKMMLEAGKHVLCEKPMTLHINHTRELVELARAKKRFLMEAIVSRVFPAYFHVRDLLDENVIGEPHFVQVTFAKLMNDVQRVSDKKLGGSVMHDLGIYGTQLASFVFKGIKPKKITAMGILNNSGVDETTIVTLDYGDNRLANIVVSTCCTLYNSAVIAGPKDYIKILPPFHYPTLIESPRGTVEFSYPETVSTDFNQGGAGLLHEAVEVKRCLDEGLLESPYITLDETIILAEISEEIAKQIGASFAVENVPERNLNAQEV